MKRILDLMILLVMTGLTALAQPNYDYARLSMEQLDRGVVAVRQADGRAFVSWRSLKSDPKGLAFDVYRNGEKLNAEPLTKGTWFIDEKLSGGIALDLNVHDTDIVRWIFGEPQSVKIDAHRRG